MSRKIVAKAHMEDGSLRIHHERDFLAALSVFKGNMRVTVEKETRSISANNLYWLWNGIVGQVKGYDPEDVHAINKEECNAKHITWIDKKTGEIKDRAIPGSSARLSVDAFSEFMERVQRFWAEQDVDLPGPDEEGTIRP